MNETAVKGLIALALASVSAYFHEIVAPVALVADLTPYLGVIA